MPWIPFAAGALGNIAGGIIGANAQGSAADQAKAAYEQSVRDYEKIGIPSIEAQQMVMEKYKSQGQWTPELEQTVNLGNSAMEGVSTDPRYKEAQMNALGQLQQIGNEGGMMLSDRANLEKIQGNIAADQRGAREAILQDAQQRGGYGSGTALGAQLMQQQAGASQAHEAGLNTAAQAQARALAAIQGAGELGTGLRTQEFGEQEKIAQAKDAIAKWNAANQQQVGGMNTGLRNEAQKYNLGNAQTLANANTDLSNQQQQYNKQLQQTQFQNQMQLAAGKANARAGQATNDLKAGQAQGQMWGQIGSGLGQAGSAMSQYMQPKMATQPATQGDDTVEQIKKYRLPEFGVAGG